MSAARNMTSELLMPKATAVWLIENTILTFKQIAEFSGLTEIEIEALANEDIGRGLVGRNPIDNKELTKEELERCQADPASSLVMMKSDLPPVKSRAKGPRYTPVSKRADKPNAIAYVLKHNSEITDAQLCKLIGTTKPTIQAVRDRSHKDASNIKPTHPADLGLCSYKEFEKAVDKGLKAQGKDPEAERAKRMAQQQASIAPHETTTEDSGNVFGGFDFSNFINSSSPNNEPASEKINPEDAFKSDDS